ncbi:ganglioside GM2 activator-like [Ruditapes philippinarum]|uniref:ganglioside GM2 activator-like n=1 Tax=Ruditapes philippinarum TaxID=129788 RepID=UPI00295A6FAD|nr:ganglioside GM2 activator-like [Ruditapes philippinarum]
MLRILVCLGAVSVVSALLPFKLTDCSKSSNKLVNISNIHISNIDPIHIPGNETVSVDVELFKPIDGRHLRAELTIVKKAFLGYIVIPCFEDPSKSVCSWELCDILSGRHYNNVHHCPMEVVASSPDINCACPFTPGTYHVNPTHFVIDGLPQAVKFLAQGDYKAHITITDTDTNEQVVCYDLQLSTGTDCVGPLCVFGKK